MSIRRVAPGSTFKGVLTASAWNDIADMWTWFEGHRRDKDRTVPTAYPHPGVVKVRNDTGVDVPWYGVIKLNDPVFNPGSSANSLQEFQQEPLFNGVLPTGATDRFAIVLEPAEANTGQYVAAVPGTFQETVRAVVSGITQCRINVTDATHGFAVPASGDVDKLVSSATGGAEIVWKESGTGTLWALIRMTDSSGLDTLTVRGSSAGTAYTFPANTILQIGTSGETYTLTQAGVTVTIPDASATTGGVVSAIPQSFGGVKSFVGILVASTDLFSGIATFGGDTSISNSGRLTLRDTTIDPANATTTFRNFPNSGFPGGIGDGYAQLEYDGDSVSAAYIRTRVRLSRFGTCLLDGNEGGSLTDSRYAVMDSAAAQHSGAYGTGAAGDVFKGGLWISAGSGVVALTVGTTTIASGTNDGVLFNNGGVLGNTAAGTAGQLLIWGSPPAPQTMSGDATIGSTGVLTIATVTVAKGGTGRTTLTAFSVLVGNGTGTVAMIGPSATTGAPLISAGSGANPPYSATGVKIDSSYGAITADSDGATITFNLATSNLHTVTLGGDRTLALSNATTGQIFVIRLLQDGTGTRLVTWFSTIKWPAGTTPTLTTTAGKADMFVFLCTGTNTYDGFVVGQNL